MTGSTANVRAGAEADATELARVQYAAALEGFRSIFPPEATKPTPEGLLRSWLRLLRDPEATALVAEVPASEELNLVGGVAVGPDDANPSELMLHRLYVDPAAWGLGIGALLHDRAVEVARESGMPWLYLWVLEGNGRARAMYQRRGWELVPDAHLYHDSGVAEAKYRLRL